LGPVAQRLVIGPDFPDDRRQFGMFLGEFDELVRPRPTRKRRLDILEPRFERVELVLGKRGHSGVFQVWKRHALGTTLSNCKCTGFAESTSERRDPCQAEPKMVPFENRSGAYVGT